MKQTPMKKWIAKSAVGIFLFSLLIPGVNAVDSGIELNAIDTVAGFGALVRVSNAPADAPLELLLEKPDGSQVLIEAESDQYGTAKVDIEGFYTKKSGEYEIQARAVNRNEDFGAVETFEVYADSVSSSRSLLEVSRQTAAANGNDYVQLKIHLYDRYSNPISGHTVDIISSRYTDEVMRVSASPYTNELGTIIYNIYSRESGVATLIAHDSTEGVTLNERAEIAFYEPGGSVPEMGGSKTGVMLASSTNAGPVSYLEVEDLDETVTVGSTLNFTITAYDEEGNIATDYTGEIRFSCSDSNATLPNDYEFEAEDQGSHTFSLSLSFKTEGTQTLIVTDLDDTDIYGEFEVEVQATGSGNSSTSGNSSSTQAGDFVIFTPIAGTYSTDTITFSGEADYGYTIDIYDNDDLVASTNVTAMGEFSYALDSLEDGTHEFILATVDSNDEVQDMSDEIEVVIDLTPPEMDQISIEPDGDIPAGDAFVVSVYSEKNLPEVGVIFNNGIYELTEDVSIDGLYEGALTAPTSLGEYELDVLLVDDIGNEVSYNDAATITIIENENLYEAADDTEETVTEEETPDDEETTTEKTDEEEEAYDPGLVSGVEAVAGDGRVTLSWESPLEEEVVDNEETAEEDGATEETTEEEVTTDEGIIIDHYRIYYGPTPDLMFSSIDTWDNSTTWYIPDLSNDTTYYFAIVPMDTEGNEGLQRSETVSETPEDAKEVAVEEAEMAREEEAAEEEAAEEAIETAVVEEEIPTETGPEVLWLLLFSVMFVQGYSYFRKPKPKIIVPMQDIH